MVELEGLREIHENTSLDQHGACTGCIALVWRFRSRTD